VDQELSSVALRAKSNSQVATDVAVHSSASADLSSDELRRIRIALGEYARQSGMHDPIDVLAFTRLCIEGASERLIAISANDTEALLHESLRIASETCGLCNQKNSDAMSTPQQVRHDAKKSDPIKAASNIAARASGPAAVMPVPEPHERKMPPQPLGELPDLRPAQLWASLMQAAWRPVGTLLSAMFARSEQ
jgi:hypothetical protein